MVSLDRLVPRHGLVAYLVFMHLLVLYAILFPNSWNTKKNWFQSTSQLSRKLKIEVNGIEKDTSTAPQQANLRTQPPPTNSTAAAPQRLLCIVLTIAPNHQTRARSVNRTWAPRCDRTLFCSNVYSSELPMLKTPNIVTSTDKKFVTQRLYSTFRVLYPNISREFDWIYVTDDDTYAIVENLRHHLRRYSPSEPHYLGFNYPMYDNQEGNSLVFAHGGSGVVLSRGAFDVLMTKGIEGARICVPSKHYGAYADINIGWCLKKLGIIAKETADTRGRERFLKENPFQLLQNSVKDELKMFGYRDVIVQPQRLYEGLSEETIAVHYVTPGEMYALDFFLYNLARGGSPPLDRRMLGIPSRTKHASAKAALQKLNHG